ncbi:MAG: signal peptidase II [Candidatus Margulisiibacteriota bacterium]
MLFYFVAFLTAAVDQLIKILVHQKMFLGQSSPLLGNILRLTYVRNTGAAFSLLVGFSPYLMIVGLVISLIVIYIHYRVPANDTFLQVALAFILGGSLGNLVDRVLRGYVIDYLDLTFWPVFNLADIMINIGVIMVALRFFTLIGGKNVSRAF